jgi:hypothetical protein
MLVSDEAFQLHPRPPSKNQATTRTSRSKLSHQEKAKTIENRNDLRGEKIWFLTEIRHHGCFHESTA